MKATAIDSAVLGGQGCIGSGILTVPNPAPPQGPPNGSGPAGNLPTAVASAEVVAGAAMPADYPLTSPLNEPQSMYSVPVQKG